jgi:hypothetical protein
MMNLSPNIRLVLGLALNAVAYPLGVLSHLVVLNRYAWTGNPSLANYVDPDNAFLALIFSALGFICGVLAFVISLLGIRKSHFVRNFILLIVSTGSLFICAYRLAEVIPVYPGGW